MFKFAVFLAVLACASAAPKAKPGFVAVAPAAPVVAAAPVPVATSYANTVKISSAPLVHTTYHAAAVPVAAVHPAPVAYHAAPAVAVHPAVGAHHIIY